MSQPALPFSLPALQVVDHTTSPAREARTRPVPRDLNADLVAVLEARHPGGIYAHQADAIEQLLARRNVVIATPTASGKSLPGHAYGVHLALGGRKTLALYPVRALLADQLHKWQAYAPLGVRVGVVDGSVPVGQRAAVVANSDVVLATPDVVHAWFMTHLDDPAVRAFLGSLALMVIDEAHVYDGVFGTNFAYLMRRFTAVAPGVQVLASTATVADPQGLLNSLCGVPVVVIDDDASRAPVRHLVLAQPRDSVQRLLGDLAQSHRGRFLAFMDSCIAVERATVDVLGSELDPADLLKAHVLPYRAGYEEADRRAIQDALGRGTLRGVISTSALELGLDIGAIDLVVCVGVPPSRKALWQRVGRAGRQSESVALVLDTAGRFDDSAAWHRYLGEPLEPNWLYFDNAYLLYANALCAAAEHRQWGHTRPAVYAGLPAEFARHVHDEIGGGTFVADELYHIKQRAGERPQLSFPLRSGIETTFRLIERATGRDVGTIARAQMLREAYPGASYYHMARRYTVRRLNETKGEIELERCRDGNTTPDLRTTVHADLAHPLGGSYRTAQGLLAEFELQVLCRVFGFRVRRGDRYVTERYAAGSPFAQRPVERMFRTTGVAMVVPQTVIGRVNLVELVEQLKEFACAELGIQANDVGVGALHLRGDTVAGVEGPVCGVALYDEASGSLRLTERVMNALPSLLPRFAARHAAGTTAHATVEALRQLLDSGAQSPPSQRATAPAGVGDARPLVIRPGGQGVLRRDATERVVEIKAVRYTPDGLMYELELAARAGSEPVVWRVSTRDVTPISGLAELGVFDAYSGTFVEDTAVGA